ncbi:MAG: hypothetical protein ACUVRA_06155 [Candidatus Bathyarchaeaceae archaeon]
MSMMNNYRKGWALRYLREAKAELTAAQKTPYLAPSLVLGAVRKAQAAIYYSFGDPASIEMIIYQTLQRKQFINDPILRFLVEIERTIQQIAQSPRLEIEKVIEQVDDFIQMTSEIVELFTGESA